MKLDENHENVKEGTSSDQKDFEQCHHCFEFLPKITYKHLKICSQTPETILPDVPEKSSRVCQFCFMDFSQLIHKNSHIDLHEEKCRRLRSFLSEGGLKCNICGKTFEKTKYLDLKPLNHIEEEHQNQIDQMQNAVKQEPSEGNMGKSCTFCKSPTFSDRRLCLKCLETLISQIEGKRVRCQICHQEFENRISVLNHIDLKHLPASPKVKNSEEDTVMEVEVEQKQSPTGKNFLCEICKHNHDQRRFCSNCLNHSSYFKKVDGGFKCIIDEEACTTVFKNKDEVFDHIANVHLDPLYPPKTSETKKKILDSFLNAKGKVSKGATIKKSQVDEKSVEKSQDGLNEVMDSVPDLHNVSSDHEPMDTEDSNQPVRKCSITLKRIDFVTASSSTKKESGN